MTHLHSLLLLFTLICVWETAEVRFARAEPTPPKEKATVKFRWLESKHVKGLTSPEMIQTSCGGDYRYAHIEAVLTHVHVAKAHKSRLNYPGIGILFSVKFDLTPEAKDKLVESCSTNGCRLLGVFVDGKYWGAWYFRPKQVDKFRPMAGYRKSEDWAVRIVNACQKPDE